jgi:hypothetical protein
VVERRGASLVYRHCPHLTRQILPWDWDVDTQVSDLTLAYLARHFNQTRHFYATEDRAFRRLYLLDVNAMSWERERGDGMNIIDARWIDTENGLFIDITGLSETRPDTEPGVWSCKNEHRYGVRDLYPMRESVFEGVPAKVPYAYEKLLVEEYDDKALTLTEYEGCGALEGSQTRLTAHRHRWDKERQQWVEKSIG